MGGNFSGSGLETTGGAGDPGSSSEAPEEAPEEETLTLVERFSIDPVSPSAASPSASSFTLLSCEGVPCEGGAFAGDCCLSLVTDGETTLRWPPR